MSHRFLFILEILSILIADFCLIFSLPLEATSFRYIQVCITNGTI